MVKYTTFLFLYIIIGGYAFKSSKSISGKGWGVVPSTFILFRKKVITLEKKRIFDAYVK